jgi:hypothetical protein
VSEETEEGAPSSAGDLLRALVPGALRTSTLLLSLGAAAVGLVLVGLVLFRGVDAKVIAAALIVWGHGAVWLTTGTVQRLDSGLADLAGAQWGVFFAVWWVPVAVLWGVAGALLG